MGPGPCPQGEAVLDLCGHRGAAPSRGGAERARQEDPVGTETPTPAQPHLEQDVCDAGDQIPRVEKRDLDEISLVSFRSSAWGCGEGGLASRSLLDPWLAGS